MCAIGRECGDMKKPLGWVERKESAGVDVSKNWRGDIARWCKL